MCGFAGWWESEAATPHDEGLARLRAMLAPMIPRGPDEEGTWLDPEAGVALGFRRLAILDLTPAGHQPMASHSGRYELVFNGEIYNHGELRRELESSGIRFRGRSDTEVLLEALEAWGMEATLPRLNGMFALALWDRREHCLRLARDRFGKKPLYYGWAGSTLLFGSSLNALRRHPRFRPDLDPVSISEFLRYAYVPGPRCIFKGFVKLLPGCSATVAGVFPGRLPDPVPYWDARESAERAQMQGFKLSEEESDRHLESLLVDAVRIRSEADVPVGAFLSGGIDSSLVVALRQKLGGTSVKTFTIGFPGKGFDEAPYAKAVAAHLGTEHYELYLEPRQALEVVPLLPTVYDEPFADSSQIPTFLVSQLARQQVTVALSGDGGDELFGGYDRYGVGHGLHRTLRWFPSALRRGFGEMCLRASDRSWDSVPGRVLGRRFGAARLKKLGHAMKAGTFLEAYRATVATWVDPTEATGGECWSEGVFETLGGQVAEWHPVHQMMLLDARTYLVDDILVKVDRASMANSLEVRNPFLDPRVVDHAWQRPLSQTWAGGEGKRCLRRILGRHVPAALVDRPKMGFGVPLGAWLRGPLREWADDLLQAAVLQELGLMAEPIRRVWDGFLEKNWSVESQLWPIVVLAQWGKCSSHSDGVADA